MTSTTLSAKDRLRHKHAEEKARAQAAASKARRLGLLALAGGFVLFTLRDRRTRAHTPDPQPATQAPPACHASHDTEGLPR